MICDLPAGKGRDFFKFLKIDVSKIVANFHFKEEDCHEK
jgi:hypothetical protein